MDHKLLEWLESTKASKSCSQRLEWWSLELIINQIEANQQPQNTGQWRKFPLCRYRQLWHQLVLHDSLLYCKIKHPSTAEAKLLIVAPISLCKKFLYMAHDASGHQGTDKTLVRLSDFTYWVGMAKEVGNYCIWCTTCQMVKAPATPPAPLQPIVTSRPWEMVAVDILKVPMSSRGNNYLLVAQDYFSKWPFAIAFPDQKATTGTSRSSLYHGWTSSKALLRPGEKLWKPYPLWVMQGIWGGEIPHDSLPPNGGWEDESFLAELALNLDGEMI